ncbi:MAG: hypothetical protein ACLFSW_03165 [Halobacteriales archaeon]
MFGQSRPFDYLKQDLRDYLSRARKHRDEKGFQRSLEEHLRGMEYVQRVNPKFTPPRKDIPRGYNYRSELDLEVVTPDGCMNAALELKHDFGGAGELDRLERQLRDYSQVWSHIAVCAQGIDNYEHWGRIKSQFEKNGGAFGNGQEIVFISGGRDSARNSRQGRRESRQNQSSMNPFDNLSNPFDRF